MSYSRNDNTEAISARLMPGLKGRIDFECQQSGKWNRNKFINLACSMLLDLRFEVACGNLDPNELPPAVARFSYLLT